MAVSLHTGCSAPRTVRGQAGECVHVYSPFMRTDTCTCTYAYTGECAGQLWHSDGLSTAQVATIALTIMHV